MTDKKSTRIFNQSVWTKPSNIQSQNFVKGFLMSRYCQPGSSRMIRGRLVQSPDRLFGTAFQDGSFLMHYNQFQSLLEYMKGYGFTFDESSCGNHKDYPVAELNAAMREGFSLYEYQEKCVSFLEKDNFPNKLVPFQTGKGKTVVALSAISRINQRAGILILPTYIEKWVGDIQEILEVEADQIFLFKGAKSIHEALELQRAGEFNYPFSIFSSTTMQNWVREYETDTKQVVEEFGIHPIQLLPLLKIGVGLIDEAHQHFHSIFKTVLYFNVKRLIGLSATMTSDDSIIRNLHQVMFPSEANADAPAYDAYAYTYAVNYSINAEYRKKIQISEWGSRTYSHTAFEKSILRFRVIWDRYYCIIKEAIESYFLEEYQKGDKLIIFVATVNMATQLTERLEQLYPQFDVRRYVEQDPYENLMDADIRVTTHTSAGTAVDIRGLTTAIQTVAMSSSVGNLQSFGRLRKIPDRTVRYCYLYSSQINKHGDYHQKRKELFKTRSKIFAERMSGVSL